MECRTSEAPWLEGGSCSTATDGRGGCGHLGAHRDPRRPSTDRSAPVLGLLSASPGASSRARALGGHLVSMAHRACRRPTTASPGHRGRTHPELRRAVLVYGTVIAWANERQHDDGARRACGRSTSPRSTARRGSGASSGAATRISPSSSPVTSTRTETDQAGTGPPLTREQPRGGTRSGGPDVRHGGRRGRRGLARSESISSTTSA